jgi:hypothetical protein
MSTTGAHAEEFAVQDHSLELYERTVIAYHDKLPVGSKKSTLCISYGFKAQCMHLHSCTVTAPHPHAEEFEVQDHSLELYERTVIAYHDNLPVGSKKSTLCISYGFKAQCMHLHSYTVTAPHPEPRPALSTGLIPVQCCNTSIRWNCFVAMW